jgi:hypothetical protein
MDPLPPVDTEPDPFRAVFVAQGLVPTTCTLDGMIIYACVLDEEDPCAGCNTPRKQCGGRPNMPGKPHRGTLHAVKLA